MGPSVAGASPAARSAAAAEPVASESDAGTIALRSRPPSLPVEVAVNTGAGAIGTAKASDNSLMSDAHRLDTPPRYVSV